MNKKDDSNHESKRVGKMLNAMSRRDITSQHMNDNDLLSNKQFGFIKGRFTSSPAA